MDEFDRENALRWTWRGKLLHRIANLLRLPARIGMYPIGKRRKVSGSFVVASYDEENGFSCEADPSFKD